MKFIWPILLIIALLGGGYYWYNNNYGGQTYYVYISDSDNGTEKTEDASDGTKIKFYYYEETAVDAKGKSVKVKFSKIDSPIAKNNFLGVKYNQNKKDVVSWEKVSESSVPALVKEQIKK